MPLLAREPTSREMDATLRDGVALVVWWGTRIECEAAIARRLREGSLNPSSEMRVRGGLDRLMDAWTEVRPTDGVRNVAVRVLAVHPLRAADSLQLAAALVWADGTPDRLPFVCLDKRLSEAARKEGFEVHPRR